MIKLLLAIIGCIISLNLNGQHLEKHLWENRVLIVKTKDKRLKKYHDQLEAFSHSIESLKDRKLVLYEIIESNYKATDFKNSNQQLSGEVSVHLAEEILNQKHIFEIILIGLDGGIKLRRTTLLTKEELFNKIDSMPMRQAELSNRQ